MERDLVPWSTREAAFGAMESSPSRCTSGCQSGWTLYLDHSNAMHCEPAQRWMVLHAGEDQEEAEDSMVSDASSGPRPRLREEDDEMGRDFGHQHRFFGQHSSYSSSSCHRSASGSGSGSGCFGSSTWSRSFLQGGAKSDARRAVVVQGEEATRQCPEIVVLDDDDDELDDTASSSAVFSCPMAMVQANFSS
ncbi:uncharacterized protein LOC133923454 [Phragmites australis]|uniref:uncharacterized protein LOC133923454 n=1 Tax=Phragmites australis TaxID=29695 RepID=UPI002D799164|nr:uncharacterized protein LOC133923454 [Phragmites australis]